jgi:hypothetical protein
MRSGAGRPDGRMTIGDIARDDDWGHCYMPMRDRQAAKLLAQAQSLSMLPSQLRYLAISPFPGHTLNFFPFPNSGSSRSTSPNRGELKIGMVQSRVIAILRVRVASLEVCEITVGHISERR